MVYLLHSVSQENYLLIDREDVSEYLYNGGTWTPVPPHTTEHFSIIDDLPVEINSNGSTINWWLTKYFDFANATCIKRCKTLDNYKKWISTHPELLI